MLWLVLIALICIVIYWKVIKPLSYWRDRGIPYQEPWPIVGNMAPAVFRKKHIFDIMIDLYTIFPNNRYNGFHQFTSPTLLIRDLELIKKITIKDFDHFTDHFQFIPEDAVPLLGKNLLFLKGQRWRNMRNTLSPAFTGSKMKGMFLLLSECALQFTEYFEKQGSDLITLEIKEMFTRYTTDTIASIAFGLKVNSLEDRDNEFFTIGKVATNFTGFRALKFFMFTISPNLAQFLRLNLFPKEVDAFFRRIVKETIQQREREGLIRPDMIHLLMEARKGRLNDEPTKDQIDTGFATVQESHVEKEEKHKKLELTDDDITAQALVFFFAGFETTATLLSFIVYELALNPDIQEKLQGEIDDALESCNGKLTYEVLMRMKYLDMVVSETLRKWPQMFQIDRVCVKDYTIQPMTPDEVPLTIKKGQVVMASIIGIHRDPNFFPNPEKFDPERFSEENKHNIEPSSYMPFGAGPRSCIASRLALLQNKTLCFYLLSKFNIVVVEKTPIPLIIQANRLNLVPEGGFWLGLKIRTT